jgi:hypothetical protein
MAEATDEPKGDLGQMDKRPMASKKFVAYLVAELTWKVALFIVLILGMKEGTIDHIVGGLALAIVIVAGFIEAGYIIGQASLDKYTRIAEIAAGAGHKIKMNGDGKLQVEHPDEEEEPEEDPDPDAAG